MLKVTFKSLLERKSRLLLSTMSIILGIAFVAGSLMFTDMLSRSLQELLKSTVADVNVLPPEHTIDSPNSYSEGLTSEDVSRVRAVPGVARVEPRVTNIQTYLLDGDNRLLGIPNAPGLAFNWHDAPAAGGLTGARIIEGKAPVADTEVALDPVSLARAGHAVGDTVRISTPFDGVHEYKVVGTATFGTGVQIASNYVFFTLPESQRLFTSGKDIYPGLWVVTEQGADPETVAGAIKEALPDGWEGQTGAALGAEVEKELATGLGFVNNFLLVFAGIGLLVASLLILNTFSILVAQRSRELAVLRAIGATRKQIRRCVLAEAVVVGLLGATLGIAAGYGLVWGILRLFKYLGMGLGDTIPQLTLVSIVASYTIGVLITGIAALVPALRASRTRPIEALTKANTPKEGVGRGWTVLGTVGIEIAAALLACGILLDVPQPIWWIGVGAALMLVSAVLAAPLIGLPIIYCLGGLFKVVFGEVGRLAVLNSRRQPRRTSATAATLMIGLSLVTTVAVLTASVSSSLRSQLTRDQRGDYVVAPVGFRPFDAHVVEQLTAVPGVGSVAAFYPAKVTFEGVNVPVAVVGTTDGALSEATATEFAAGEFTSAPDSLIVSEKFAQEKGLKLGQRLTVTGPLGKQELLLTGITKKNAPGEAVLQLDTLRLLVDVSLVQNIVVFAASGADDQLGTALKEATVAYPAVTVAKVSEYIEMSIAQFESLVRVLYALLGLALVISVLGIVNTLSLSVIERKREIGLLRAVGLTRAQLRRTITLESVLITINGTLLGIGLGVLFGFSLQQLNSDKGIEQLSLPWTQLGLFVAVAAIFGLVAALAPARMAARQPVLEAIANE
ncbi:ABC transporter permease [Tessaracoccus sp. OH4464_COT-324]|uniref:ABC transporter permease n=1 Tax=Tessaracoccus sp. OH4464_COT-324 TaxID=2491059 RepID=UPI000F640D43|nr:FtsX-like permease family protein [Tessaracoccus sp. OH4464_COT-324]RRD46130.1 FtsX-like permease family protein [Tessaracoccus sp. OH4464_COT-324]